MNALQPNVSELLAKLEADYRKILHRDGDGVDISFENTYRAMYVLVAKGAARRLYDLAVRVLEEELHLEHHRDEAVYMRHATMVNDCCMYLGRSQTWNASHASESRHFVDNPPTPITEVARALFARRGEIMRARARMHFAILRRNALLVGRLARFVRLLYNTAHYRPGGDGQKRSHEEFAAAAQKQDA